MTILSDPQSRGYTRLAGALYLSVAILGPFAILYVPSQIQVAGDPIATLGNLEARRGLFLAGAGADSLIMLVEVALSVLLYFMFKPVNATLAGIAGLTRLMESAVMGAMLLFSAAALGFADPATAPIGFDEAQRAGLASLMLHIHDAGVWVWQVFFFLHLVILGFLVVRSGQYPRLIGYGMSIGAIGYLLESVHGAAFPDAALLGTVTGVFLAIVSLAEITFAIWLTFRGPRPASA